MKENPIPRRTASFLFIHSLINTKIQLIAAGTETPGYPWRCWRRLAVSEALRQKEEQE